MPKRDRQGPPKESTGKRDGSGQGKGNYSRNKAGTGTKTGGGGSERKMQIKGEYINGFNSDNQNNEDRRKR